MILRPLGPADEAEASNAHAELAAEDFEFLHRYGLEDDWPLYLSTLTDARLGRNLPDGHVPAIFLVAEAAGCLVGRVSIRHTLTPLLETVGGHIGYAVRPAHRRKGFATRILRGALAHAHELGIERTLVTCDIDNVGSRTVIERCGGVLDPVRGYTSGGAEKLRYWVPTGLG